MRVLVLNDTYPPHNQGGAGVVAYRLSRELARRGHQVRVLTTVTERCHAGLAVEEGVEAHRIVASFPDRYAVYLGLWYPPAAAAVRREAQQFRPDIVHAHNVHSRLSFHSLQAARATGAPVVQTVHDYLFFCPSRFTCSGGRVDYCAVPRTCPKCRRLYWRNPLRTRIIRWYVRRNVARLLAISHAQRTLLDYNGFGGATVVYNGVDPAECTISPEQIAAFRRAHALDGRPVVLFGGRISIAKGGDQMIEIMRLVRARIANAVLLAVGDNQHYLPQWRRALEAAGLAESTRLLGWISGETLRAAYGACHVCVTPSIYPDPFNLINIEAMAFGKPVVGTCFGGTPEIVVDGETGYIANPLDPQGYAERLVRLLEDPVLRARMGEAGRRRVEERFSLARQAEEVEQVYRSVLSSHTGQLAR
jgi:glycosyltransferase involved in cell wall biosynthesis